MSELFSPEWKLAYLNQWNADPEMADALANIHFDSTIAYGFKDLSTPKGVEFFKVLSEISRLQILSYLRSGPMTVNELAEATELGQANVSKHLKMLTQIGIIFRTASGVSAYYEIIDPMVFEIYETVCDSLSERLMEQARKFDQFKVFSTL